MFKDIEQAESAIKSGDTKTGFEILRSYLAENPDSERAWWVMSGLVERSERRTCLEQVLRINPNNKLARETLDKLLASPQKPETKPQRDLPHSLEPETEPAVDPPDFPGSEIELGYPVQAFLFKKGKRIHLTLLDGVHIIRAQTTQDNLPAVRDAVKRGQLPEGLLSEIKTITLESIQAVKLSGSSLIVQYLDGPGEHTTRMPFEDEEKAQAILGVLTKNLGPDYMIQARSKSNTFKLVLSTLLTLGSAAFVAAVLWTLPQVGAGLAGDSWRARMVSRLVESLGYSGVVLISLLLVLAALGLSAYMLLKPQVSTELVRRS